MAAPKLKYAIGNGASTTTSGSITGASTSVDLTANTNFQAKSGEGMLMLDEGQSAEELAYSTGNSGATYTIPSANRGLEGGSAQSHSSGATAKGVLSAGMWNDLIDSLLNVLSQSTGAVDTTKVVTLTGTQVLTNKSIDGDDNTLTDLPAANLKIASQAAGDLLYASSASAWARLAKSTDGYVLTSGSTPSYKPRVPIYGYADCSGDGSSTSSTFADITGMTTDLALGSGTYTVVVWASQTVDADSAGNNVQIRISIDGSTGGVVSCQPTANQALHCMNTSYTVTGKTGTITCKAQFARQAGSGTVRHSNTLGHLMAIAYPE